MSDIVEYGWWNQLEKINENWIQIYPLYTTLNSNTDTDIHIDV